MRIGPSQRVRRAGEVRCAQTTEGSAARVASMSNAVSASEMSRRRSLVSACQRASRSRVNVSTRPRCSIDSSPGRSPSALESRPRASTAAAVNSAKPLARASAAPVALQQPVDDDDVRPGQLVATGDAAPDERAVVDEHLEVELGSQPARVAVTGRRLIDAAQPAPEGEVRRFDRVEQEGPVGAAVLDEHEGGIALELGQPERRFQTADDRLEQVAGDDRRMLHLTS